VRAGEIEYEGRGSSGRPSAGGGFFLGTLRSASTGNFKTGGIGGKGLKTELGGEGVYETGPEPRKSFDKKRDVMKGFGGGESA